MTPRQGQPWSQTSSSIAPRRLPITPAWKTDPNYVPNGITDDASVRIADVKVNKAVVNTSESFTTGTNLTIGEEARIRSHHRAAGRSDQRHAWSTCRTPVSLLSAWTVLAPRRLSVRPWAVSATVLTNAQASLTGGQTSFNFGTLTNSSTNYTTAETITLTYTMVALNIAANMSSDTDKNRATFKWDDGSVNAKTPITIVEPKLSVAVTPSMTSGQCTTGHLYACSEQSQ